MSLKTLPVLDASELSDGQMKDVEFEGGKVLVSRLGDEIHATSAFCTHYGAPLVKGVLTADGRIVCPWHGACFNVHSGDIEDAPALADIHVFKAAVDGASGKICVTADPARTQPQNKSRPSKAATTDFVSNAKGNGVVIVGGGAGAWATVQSLRGNGYKLPITVLSKEPHVPIDRTKLSKMLISDVSKIELSTAADLKIKFGTNIRTGVTATAISLSTQTITINGGFGEHPKDVEEIGYDYLVLASGSNPRRLPIDGAQEPSQGGKDNVFTLRGVKDAKRIDDAATGDAHVVFIGSSFIAMELAAALVKRKLGSITVVGMEEVPFQAVLGKEVGGALMNNFKNQGITFHMRSTVTSLTTSSTTPTHASGVSVKNVDTNESVTCDADVIVMAVGAAPATEYLKESGIDLRKDGGVFVDEYLRVKYNEGLDEQAKKDNVFAIGDIAVYPDLSHEGALRRIEHWNVASNHGRCVGRVISGKQYKFDKVPVFWSSLGSQLRYCGYSADHDDVIIHGEVAQLKFIAYYVKNGKVVAVASMSNDPVVGAASELFRLGRMPTPEELKAGKHLLDIPISKRS